MGLNLTKHKNILVLLSLLLAALINYCFVPFLFWQQDEWVTFANLIQSGINITWHGIDVESTHFSPISNFLTYVVFKIFSFNYSAYLIIGLVLHILNGFLIFKIAQKIIPNFLYSLLAAILFITSSSSYQLLMWPIISLNSISLTFGLLSIITLINFIKFGIHPLFRGSIVALFLALALLTIEYSAGLLLFIPITLLLFHKKLGFRKIAIFLIPLTTLIILYAGLRFYLFKPYSIVTESPSSTNYMMLVRNLVSYPFYYIGQTYIPENIIVQLSKSLSIKTDKSENYYSLRLAFLFGILIVIPFLSALRRFEVEKYPNSFKIILLNFLFIFLSSLPFIFLAGKAGAFTIFPSRYLYFGSAGGALLLSVLLYQSKISKTISLFKFIAVLIIAFILTSTFNNLQKSKDLYDKGQTRKAILEEVKSRYPILPSKSIFYFQSDTTYYGLPPEEKIPPFQGGLGQILLIWYSSDSYFPSKFYQNQYLWEITDEGYMEVEGIGYGYFRNWDKLQKIVSSHHLSPDSVTAFSWKGQTNTLTDITTDVRQKLSSYSSDNLIR